MKIDKKTLQKLLALNDEQLKAVIGRLVAEAGLDLGVFNVTPEDIAGIRAALSAATDEDIMRIAQQLGASGIGKK